VRVLTRTIALSMLCGSTAAAQTCEQWLPTPGSGELFNGPRLAVADHDGPGPLPPRLYATGESRGINSARTYLQWWDGLRWQPVAAWTASLSPACMLTLEQDAAGLAAGTLLLGSGVSVSAGTRVLTAFDGQQLTPVGPTGTAAFSTSANLAALCTWDPDGNGPIGPWIIAGGTFTKIGNVNAANIAAWDGVQWRPLGAGRPTTVVGLHSFDTDGDGPGLPLLIANDAAWDGVTWQTLGAGFNSSPTAHATFDSDNDGVAELYASGGFSTSGAATVRNIARWTGSQWVEPGSNQTLGTVSDLKVLDLDGNGPAPRRLVATKAAAQVLIDGVWTSLPSVHQPATSGRALAQVDPDGPGPRAEELILSGSATNAAIGVTPHQGPFSHDGQKWRLLGDEFAGGRINDFVWHDEDGVGAIAPALHAIGTFTYAGGTPADGLAKWDGQRWRGLGMPSSSRLPEYYRAESYDHDGLSVTPPQLLSVDSWRVMSWNGTAWVSPNMGGSGTLVLGMAQLHPATSGERRLFVGGDGFVVTHTSGPVFQPTTGDGAVRNWCLFTHDEDGVGPSPQRAFLWADGTPSLRCWDGSLWAPFASISEGNGSKPPAATSWDPDGPGPLNTHLVLGASSFSLPGSGGTWAWAFDQLEWSVGWASMTPTRTAP
jgi:hypothetical protein